ADRNRSHWSTSKTPSYTKSVSWQHHQISVRQYYQKRVIFYPTTLQRTACKKCLFLMRDIIISS
ncbi:hypothetical protein GPL05_05110, partial [Enterobacteriaceae bacterium MCC505]|nr:hypothetical protein [Enterobacteriaceae bacterium MCC505]